MVWHIVGLTTLGVGCALSVVLCWVLWSAWQHAPVRAWQRPLPVPKIVTDLAPLAAENLNPVGLL